MPLGERPTAGDIDSGNVLDVRRLSKLLSVAVVVAALGSAVIAALPASADPAPAPTPTPTPTGGTTTRCDGRLTDGVPTTCPPLALPGTPVVTDITATTANLTWTAPTFGLGIVGYNVYRHLGDADLLLMTTATTAAALIDLTPSTQYLLFVRARTSSGSFSGASRPVTFTTAASPVGCTAAYYQIGPNWPDGFQGEVRVTNTGTTTTTAWTVTMTFADGQAVTHSWGGRTAQPSSPYTVTPEFWNAVLAPGASAIFGFLGRQSGTNTAPSVTCASAP